MIAFIIKLYFYAEAQNCKSSLPSNFTYLIVSDSNTLATGPDMPIEGNAVPCVTTPLWTANIPGATWIWDIYLVSSPGTWQTVRFRNDFGIPGIPLVVTLTIASDNNSSVTINGKNPGCEGAQHTSGSEKRCSLLPFLVSEINSLLIFVTNQGGHAGLLYSIEITTSI